MSDGYTKLFADIVDSSIWSEDSDTCKVWVTLLALSNADGLVRGSVGWLSGKAKVSPEVCSRALAKFASPDPHSRTPDNEGKRIEFLDDGWLIINYLLFRNRLSSDAKSTQTRERVRKHRERYNALRNGVTERYKRYTASASASVPPSPEGKESEEGDGFKVVQDLMTALSELYNRKPTDRWTYLEQTVLASVSRRKDVMSEFETLKQYRSQAEFFPQSVSSLLDKWTDTLDRARGAAARPKRRQRLI